MASRTFSPSRDTLHPAPIMVEAPFPTASTHIVDLKSTRYDTAQLKAIVDEKFDKEKAHSSKAAETGELKTAHTSHRLAHLSFPHRSLISYPLPPAYIDHRCYALTATGAPVLLASRSQS
jgi:hypothetical protein